jgi:hypothetical protein
MLVASLVAAFLTVALAPCPERPSRADSHAAVATAPGETSVAHEATGGELSLLPACPCGCEKAPAAGSSARLGVALPSAAIALEVTRPDPPPVDRLSHRIEPFAARIDHVPLAGPRIPA